MADPARQPERLDTNHDGATAKPERSQIRPQWFLKASNENPPVHTAPRFEGPPQPAPYIANPDTRHVDAYWRSRHMQLSRQDEPLSAPRRYSSKPFESEPPEGDYDDYDDVFASEEQQEPPPRRERRRETRRGRAGRDLAIATGLALSLSTVTGAAVYDRASGGTIAAAILAPFATEQTSNNLADAAPIVMATTTAEAAPIVETPVAASAAVDLTPDGKPVATAKLDVGDAAGKANIPVDLDLQAVPGEAGQDLELRLSGMPEDAYLTAGTQLSPVSWSLKPAEAAIVKLVFPEKQAGDFDLSVAAVEAKTGELVAPMKEINVKVDKVAASTSEPADTTEVEPAAAPAPKLQNFTMEPSERAAIPPPQVTVALAHPEPVAPEPKAAPAESVTAEIGPAPVEPVPPAEQPARPAMSEQARTLISRGDHLMSLGDLAAARQFYVEALKLGAAPTTLLQVGMTYDPVVYAANKVAGLSPDARMALDYYRQADRAGVTAAHDAIARLEAWTQK